MSGNIPRESGGAYQERRVGPFVGVEPEAAHEIEGPVSLEELEQQLVFMKSARDVETDAFQTQLLDDRIKELDYEIDIRRRQATQ